VSGESQLLTGLASNGPWALVAGFLLWQVMKAWTADRQQVTELLKEFKASIDELTHAVKAIVGERQEHGRRRD
jgi:K+ transporter